MSIHDACKELVKSIEKGKIKTQSELEKKKILISRKYRLDTVIRNSDIALFTKNKKVRKLLC